MNYQPVQHAVFREVDESIIALNLNTGQYYTMNEVAARMWSLLVSSHSLEEVLQSIVSEYEVTGERAEQDLSRLLAELETNGLIVVS